MVRRSGQQAALWLAAGVALSPVLVEMSASLFEEHSAWSSVLLFPALTVLQLIRAGSPRGGSFRTAGILSLVGALTLEISGITAAIPSIARLAVPVSVLGMAALVGWPPLPTAFLTFWAVPAPTALLAQGSPRLESTVAVLASIPAQAAGAALSVSPPLVRGVPGILEFQQIHGGIPLALLVSGLAWYAGLAAQTGSIVRLAGRAAIGAAIAWPLQIIGGMSAIAILVAGHPDAARFWLDDGWNAFLVVSAVAWVEMRRPGHVAASTPSMPRGATRRSG